MPPYSRSFRIAIGNLIATELIGKARTGIPVSIPADELRLLIEYIEALRDIEREALVEIRKRAA